jgi:hypothetical protein
MGANRLELLRKMLAQVDATEKSTGLKESLEGRTAITEGTRAGLEVRRKGASHFDAEFALESLDVLRRSDAVDSDQQFALEAIVMPYHRPVVDIAQNRMKTEQLTQKWQHLEGVMYFGD